MNLQIIEELSAKLSLKNTPTPFRRGSVFVGHVGELVLKVFPPEEQPHFETERACLQTLHGTLSVETPSLVSSGEHRGHHYLLMSRLKGEELLELWPQLKAEEHIALGHQLGTLLAELHKRPTPPQLERPQWSAWVDSRMAAVRSKTSTLGAEGELLDEILHFFETGDFSAGETGFVHTEIMLDHLLVTKGAFGWKLSGLFDFEPAMVLPLHYELSAVGLFFSKGEGPVWRAVLAGLGEEPVGARRMMSMYLMHRYCNFKFAFMRNPEHKGLSLAELTEVWFG